jgi:hypothetical protein
MQETASLTPWIAVIAIATTMQALIVVGAAVIGLKFYREATKAYREAMSSLEQFRRQELNPALHRIQASLERVDGVIDRVRTADDDLRRAVGGMKTRADDVIATVRTGFWPLVGVSRGARAALATLLSSRAPKTSRMRDEDGQNRFVREGGTSHVRS